MKVGDRVLTPKGLGTVVYVRMAPPAFTEIEAVSVRLDARPPEPTYTGTIFRPGDIRAEPEPRKDFRGENNVSGSIVKGVVGLRDITLAATRRKK